MYLMYHDQLFTGNFTVQLHFSIWPEGGAMKGL